VKNEELEDENPEEEYLPDTKPDSQGETIRKSGLAYAAAITLFASVAFLLGVGWALDRWLNSSPWGMVGGIILGSVVGLYQFVRITSQIYK
jgi:ATP synthase protein I